MRKRCGGHLRSFLKSGGTEDQMSERLMGCSSDDFRKRLATTDVLDVEKTTTTELIVGTHLP
jgi:hypothetical protein